jgi:hypothetical protein
LVGGGILIVGGLLLGGAALIDHINRPVYADDGLGPINNPDPPDEEDPIYGPPPPLQDINNPDIPDAPNMEPPPFLKTPLYPIKPPPDWGIAPNLPQPPPPPLDPIGGGWPRPGDLPVELPRLPPYGDPMLN